MSVSDFRQMYKNNEKTQEKCRRHRNKVNVQLRKEKRQEAISKHRNVLISDSCCEVNYSAYSNLNKEPLKNLAKIIADESKPEDQMIAIDALYRLLCSKTRLDDEIVEAEILQALVECLSEHHRAVLQVRAAYALQIYTMGTPVQRKKVAAAGAVPMLMRLLCSPYPNICECALKNLSNIAAASDELRNYVIDQGVIESLQLFLQSRAPNLMWPFVARLVHNLSFEGDAPLTVTLKQQVLYILNLLVEQSDRSILIHAVLSMRIFNFKCKQELEMVIDSGIILKIVRLLGHADEDVCRSVLLIAQKSILKSKRLVKIVLECNGLAYLTSLLSHSKISVRISALYALVVIAEWREVQETGFLDIVLLIMITENLRSDIFVLQTSAMCVVSSLAANGNREQTLALIAAGVIAPSCKLLLCNCIEVLDIVLEAICDIFENVKDKADKLVKYIEDCDGDEIIARLQYHPNDLICIKARTIIDRYFAHRAEIVALAPMVSADNKSYIFNSSIDEKPIKPYDF